MANGDEELSDIDESGTSSDQALSYETNYQLGQDNIRPFGLDIHNPVFAISAASVAIFVVISLFNQESSAELFDWLRPWLTSSFDWFLMISVNVIFLFCLFMDFPHSVR